jgi:hypothetical protein
MNPTKLLFLAVFHLGLFSFAMGQAVNITGTITDENGKKVYGAVVKLKSLKLSTVTDTAGNYAFTVAGVAAGKTSPAYSMPFFSGNLLTFTVARDNDRVTIETFDCLGRCVCAVRDRAMAAGTYKTIPFPEGFSSQMYICRVTVGNTVSRLMKSPLIASSNGAGYLATHPQHAYFAKQAAAVDTLLISRSGYAYAKQPIASYTGTYAVTLTVALSVSLDIDYYQGISYPMYITAKDPYATTRTVSAIIISAAFPVPDTVKLTQVDSFPGMYEDSVFFSVRPVTKGTDSIHTFDQDSITVSYHGAAPLTSVSTAKAEWVAVPPSVRPSVSIYLGLRLPININADDRNITDSAISIHLASHKDTVGINVVLHALSGSPGDYTGSVGASLTQSTPGKVIAVRPPIDTLTTIYQSPALSYPVISSALQGTALLWKCNQASIMPDSLGTGYHGTSSKMKISMEDDHIVANSVTVNVKSKKDPVGISVPLAVTDTSFIFGGTVGFTQGASNPTALTISVAGSDTVTIWYFDPIVAPPETVSVQTTWNP